MTGKAICPICGKTPRREVLPGQRRKNLRDRLWNRTRSDPVDCPSDCTYLLAAHRWGSESIRKRFPMKRSLSPTWWRFPRPDSYARSGLVRSRIHRSSICRGPTFARGRRRPGSHASAGRDLYRTLVSGIYYEKPPAVPVAAGLYAALAKHIQDEKETHRGKNLRPSSSRTRKFFYLLVFFFRFGRLRSTGRSRTRGFIEFLRAQFPREKGVAKEEPRIIMPQRLETYARTFTSRPRLSCRSDSVGLPGSIGRAPRSYFLRRSCNPRRKSRGDRFLARIPNVKTIRGNVAQASEISHPKRAEIASALRASGTTRSPANHCAPGILRGTGQSVEVFFPVSNSRKHRHGEHACGNSRATQFAHSIQAQIRARRARLQHLARAACASS